MINKFERYEDGILIEVLPYTEEELIEVNNLKIIKQIETLEALQTPRRMREALFDSSWIDDLNIRIEALRAQLA